MITRLAIIALSICLCVQAMMIANLRSEVRWLKIFEESNNRAIAYTQERLTQKFSGMWVE